MATGKRYYWIKLKETFMTSDAVDFLMGQKDGANYVVLYQMLCLKTINTDGKLERHIGEIIIPYDEAKIQRDTKYFSIDTVRIALGLYKSLGLIYVDQNGTLCLTDHHNLIGSETNWAAQKRNQRSELPPAEGGHCPPECPPNVPENVHTDIEIENRDTDIEIDINNLSDISIPHDYPDYEPDPKRTCFRSDPDPEYSEKLHAWAKKIKGFIDKKWDPTGMYSLAKNDGVEREDIEAYLEEEARRQWD